MEKRPRLEEEPGKISMEVVDGSGTRKPIRYKHFSNGHFAKLMDHYLQAMDADYDWHFSFRGRRLLPDDQPESVGMTDPEELYRLMVDRRGLKKKVGAPEDDEVEITGERIVHRPAPNHPPSVPVQNSFMNNSNTPSSSNSLLPSSSVSLPSSASLPSSSSMPAPPAPTATAPSKIVDRDRVIVRVSRYQPSQQLQEKPLKFSMRAQDELSRLMRRYCREKGLDFTKMIFTYQGRYLPVSSTPDSFGMQQDNTIVAYTVAEYGARSSGESSKRQLPTSFTKAGFTPVEGSSSSSAEKRKLSMTSSNSIPNQFGMNVPQPNPLLTQEQQSLLKQQQLYQQQKQLQLLQQQHQFTPEVMARMMPYKETLRALIASGNQTPWGMDRKKAEILLALMDRQVAGTTMFGQVSATTMGSMASSSSTTWNASTPTYGSFREDIDDKTAQEKLEKLLDHFNISIPPAERMNTPASMVVELKDYQRIGLTWMTRMERSAAHRGGILSDEMGLGKTVQAIACIMANPPPEPAADPRPASSDSLSALMKRYKQRRDRWGTLIVLPLSLMEQWRTEIENMISRDDQPRLLLYHGEFLRPAERKRFETDPNELYQYDIVMTTYTTLANQFPFDKEQRRNYTMNKFELDRTDPATGPLFRHRWHRCILDEAHSIKNRQAVSSVAVSYVDAERRWCLTGTPIQNTSDDIFSLLRFLKIEPYCYWNRFRTDLSVNPSKKDVGYQTMNREDRLKKLQAILQCCLLRRTKNSRIDGNAHPIVTLPPRTIIKDTPEFSPAERDLYSALERRNLKKFNAMLDELERNYRHILVMIMRMRQMCLHHYLVTNGQDLLKKLETTEEEIEEMIDGLDAATLRRLSDLVRNEDQDAAQCAICLDVMDNPVVTHCGHVFCGECLIGHITMRSRHSDEPIPCPNCRKEVAREQLIPYSSIEKRFGVRQNEDVLGEEELDKENSGDDVKGKGKLTENNSWTRSTKINRLMSILDETRREHPNEKTIVFCSFTKMLDLVEKALNDEKYRYVRLDGTMNITSRATSVTQFSKDVDTTVMLASLKCGCVGLNLTASNRVVLLDVWWNPAIENQAIDRVHRIGQTASNVYVTKITIPNTIEDRILDLQERKQQLTDAALNEGSAANGGAVHRLTRNDLTYLFRGGARPIDQL